MKKFLSHALPLCLALVICVCSLAVPAFAAAIPPDLAVIPEESTITGIWSFDADADPYGVTTWLHGDIYFDGQHYVILYVSNLYMSLEYYNAEGDLQEVPIRDDDGNWLSPVRRIEIIGDAACTDEFYSWFSSNARLLDDPLGISGDSIFSVIGGISGWLVSAIGTIMPMFYTDASGLTFIGTLAVAGLAVAVFFLIFMIIRRFLHFGG